MTREEAKEAILTSGGQIIGVEFIKRTTGEVRQMVCRTSVHKHLKGGERAYDFVEKDVLPVFDMQKMAYRCIPTEGITRVKVAGQWEEVK